MKQQEYINYNRVAKAIAFINVNFKKQPGLEEIAEKVHLSPFHFQRLFTDWAGVSPKKFLQYVSIQHAKQKLKEKSTNATGLSGTGRLHDLFIKVEGMTPGEYKNGGKNLFINYSYRKTPFGEVLIASTSKGICHMAFLENQEEAYKVLQNQFPNAHLQQEVDQMQQNALYIFTQDWNKLNQIKLHLKGTEFQLKVWEALLKIPLGQLSTYGSIAEMIDKPKASRAVGTAIGTNPVAFLIPCHRVIQTGGKFGGYMWGTTRKIAIIGWEAAKVDK